MIDDPINLGELVRLRAKTLKTYKYYPAQDVVYQWVHFHIWRTIGVQYELQAIGFKSIYVDRKDFKRATKADAQQYMIDKMKQ